MKSLLNAFSKKEGKATLQGARCTGISRGAGASGSSKNCWLFLLGM